MLLHHHVTHTTPTCRHTKGHLPHALDASNVFLHTHHCTALVANVHTQIHLDFNRSRAIRVHVHVCLQMVAFKICNCNCKLIMNRVDDHDHECMFVVSTSFDCLCTWCVSSVLALVALAIGRSRCTWRVSLQLQVCFSDRRLSIMKLDSLGLKVGGRFWLAQSRCAFVIDAMPIGVISFCSACSTCFASQRVLLCGAADHQHMIRATRKGRWGEEGVERRTMMGDTHRRHGKVTDGH